MEIVIIFRQTNFSQEAISLTAGDGGLSAGCQTHSNAIVKMLCQNKTQKIILYIVLHLKMLQVCKLPKSPG